MVVKCPRCQSEYDLELDDVVAEMMFSCPNCKTRFHIKNGEETNKSEPTVPAVEMAQPSTPKQKQANKRKPFLWVLAVLALLIIAGIAAFYFSSRMPSVFGNTNDNTSIILAIDVSTSMLAEDLEPNRMEAVKQTASDMMITRQNDSIGLILFAGEALTRCNMTNRLDSLNHILQDVDVKMAQSGAIEDGTAIGMGLACAINHLSGSTATNKVVVLFTDGNNNRGDISPMTATNIARIYGIRVFTVAIGKDGSVPIPMTVGDNTQTINIPSEIDTLTLQSMATATGGKSYRATSKDELRQVCQDISQQIPHAAENMPQYVPQLSKDNARRLQNAARRTERKTQERINKQH